MKINTFYKIKYPTEHVNINLESDSELFIDPFLIGNNRSNPFAKKIYNRSKIFLEHLNTNYIKTGNRKKGIQFLSNLREANEYHLGYSNVNKGKGIGLIKAEEIYDALYNNKFAKAGLSITNEADNVLLLVKGIGADNMSDILANIARDIFADFTYKQCRKYNVSVSSTKIKFYNENTGVWEKRVVELPFIDHRPVILTPTFIASTSRQYSTRYNYFISKNYLSKDILEGNIIIKNEDEYIHKLKNGNIKVNIKKINNDFKKPKDELIDYVIKYPDSLLEFKDYAKIYYLCYKEAEK